MNNASAVAGFIVGLFVVSISILLIDKLAMFSRIYLLPLLSLSISAVSTQNVTSSSSRVDLSWHLPNITQINDLSAVINGTGVYGFIFNNSHAPAGNAYYGGYNWYEHFSGG